MPWLTPNTVTYHDHRISLHCPNVLVLYVVGALDELTHPENWEQSGDITPEDIAAYFEELLAHIQVIEGV